MANFQIVAARHTYEPYPVPKLERSNIFLPPFRGWVFLKIDGHPPPQSFDVRGDLWLYICLASLRVHPVQRA